MAGMIKKSRLESGKNCDQNLHSLCPTVLNYWEATNWKMLYIEHEINWCHFLHMRKKKYRKQRRQLKGLFRDNSYRVDVNRRITDRSIYKYWKNREKLFSLINTNKICLTKELWFSVTPEAIAKFVSSLIQACLPNATTVLDVFCGGGGNLVQFAKKFPRCYGVDFNIEHLYCAYQNSRVYDVEEKVWLKYGDWIKISEKGRFEKIGIDCIFASPPWGGPEYLKQKEFDLERGLKPTGLKEMLKSFLRITSNIVLFLPRNSNLSQISRATMELLGPQAKCKVLYIKDHGYLKGMLCFWGEPFYNYVTDECDSNYEKNRFQSNDHINKGNAENRLALKLREAELLYG